jgi:hypothetical protein
MAREPLAVGGAGAARMTAMTTQQEWAGLACIPKSFQ